MVETSPRLGDGGRVAQHAHGSLHLGEISAGHDGRWLVVDAHLEARRTPVDELDRALRLDRRDGSVDVLRNNVAAVQHAAGHVLAVTRVALHHLVGRLEAGVGDLGHGQLFVVGFLGADHRRVCRQREVDSGIGHQVGLELGQINVEGAVESQRGRDGTDDLADESVQICISRSLDVEISPADVVDGLVVDHERTV